MARVRSVPEISLAYLHKAWQDANNVTDNDSIICHNNVIVSLLCSHSEAVDVLGLLCEDEEMPMLITYVLDLRTMFVNTLNWTDRDTIFHDWKVLNNTHLLQTGNAVGQRLLQEMLIVLLNRIQRVFDFESTYYEKHRLKV